MEHQERQHDEEDGDNEEEEEGDHRQPKQAAGGASGDHGGWGSPREGVCVQMGVTTPGEGGGGGGGCGRRALVARALRAITREECTHTVCCW